MDTPIGDAFETIVKRKAQNMMSNKKYHAYTGKLLKDLKPNDLTKAFKIGAVDAMILDMAASTGFRKYMERDFWEKLIKECIDAGIIPDC
jgi:hypothetical protein